MVDRSSDELWLIQHLPEMSDILASHPVQRLKRIYQVGAAALVFSAKHTRFEHSLGVSRLSAEIVKELRCKAFPVHHNDVVNVAIAGLLHDVGHGPFSHTYDDYVAAPQMQARHELRGLCVASTIIRKHAPRRMAWIMHLLAPSSYPCPDRSKMFLSNIIHSDDGIDADRLDYLMRDTRHLGMDHMCGVCPADIINNSTVANNMWTVESLPLSFLHLLRYWLHTAIYGNPAIVALDEFLGPAMIYMGVPWHWVDDDVVAEMRRRGYSIDDLISNALRTPVYGVGARVVRANAHIHSAAKYVIRRLP